MLNSVTKSWAELVQTELEAKAWNKRDDLEENKTKKGEERRLRLRGARKQNASDEQRRPDLVVDE